MIKRESVNKRESANRVIARSIVNGRTKEHLIETIEYYLNELNRLEGK